MQPREKEQQITIFDSSRSVLVSPLEIDLAQNAVMYVIIDPKRYELAVSDKFVDSIGFTKNEWAQTDDLWASRLHPDYREEMLTKARLLSSSETPQAMESVYLFQPKIGAARWIRDTVRFDGYTFMSRMEDITDYMRSTALNKASKLINQSLDLETVLTKIQEILHTVMPYDRANIVLLEDKDWRTKLKWEFSNKKLKTIKTDEPFDLENKKQVQRLVASKNPFFILDTCQPDIGYRATGDYPPGSWIGAPIYIGRNKTVIGILQVNSNVLDSYGIEDAIWLQSFAEHIAIAVENSRRMTHDGLTNLLNHNYFIQEGNLEVARVARYKGQLTALMADSDNFKYVNDTHGHRVGDILIWTYGQLFKKLTRSIDVIGRWGGEEYAFILPETDIMGANRLAERIRFTAAYVLPKVLARAIQNQSLEDVTDIDIMLNEAVNKTVEELQTELSHITEFPPGTTLSIGISTLTNDINTFDKLIEQADKELYLAKSRGKNQVSFSV